MTCLHEFKVTGLRSPAIAAMMAAMAVGCHKDSFPTEPRSLEDVFGSLKTKWIAPQIGWSFTRPVIVGDKVILTTGDRRLIARDLQTGATRWSTTVTSVNAINQPWGMRLIATKGVVVAGISRNTVGLDVTTGQQLWSYEAPTDTLVDPPGKPASVELTEMDADDSTVFIPAWGGSVSAVNVQTGTARWIWRPPAGTQFRVGAQGVRASGDTIFATVWHDLSATNSGAEIWLVALDKRDGSELGRATIPPFTIGNPVLGRPAIWKGLVIIVGVGGFVWAMDRSSYQIVWKYSPPPDLLEGGGYIGPEIAGDTVFTDSRGAVGLRASDGVLVWKARLMGPANRNFLVTPRRVYVPESGFLDVIDRATGHYIARVQTPNRPSDGTLFSTAPVTAGTDVCIGINAGAWCFREP